MSTCARCAARLGHLFSELPEELAGLWPSLAPTEEDLEPEPKVRQADGTERELREVTAELKKELTVEARAQLAEAYGLMGLHREQVLECAWLLREAAEAPEVLRQALGLLFSPTVCAPHALDSLRGRLFPS